MGGLARDARDEGPVMMVLTVTPGPLLLPCTAQATAVELSVAPVIGASAQCARPPCQDRLLPVGRRSQRYHARADEHRLGKHLAQRLSCFATAFVACSRQPTCLVSFKQLCL
jgi:hypothetical protein